MNRTGSGVRNLANESAAYVTPSELARYWRVDVSTVLGYIRSGWLPALRFSKTVFRVRTADAIAFERAVAPDHESVP